MLCDVVPILRCPHCGGGLTLAGDVLVCAERHSFDVARPGYVRLFGGDVRQPGDTAEMVAARERFLSAGHFEPLAAAVAAEGKAIAGDEAQRRVVDLGAGPGYYLARVLEALATPTAGLALASSKHALRRGARARPGVG